MNIKQNWPYFLFVLQLHSHVSLNVQLSARMREEYRIDKKPLSRDQTD